MARDYGVEIDSLKDELSEIKQLLHAFTNPKVTSKEPQKKTGRIHKMVNMHPNPAIMNILYNLENTCEQNEQSGAITYLGVYESGGRQSTWIRNEVNTDGLLSLIENKMAGKVLNCIGNSDRLNILLYILKKPMTVAQLVEECGYSSTGQVYHHLKPLIAADLIVEDVKNEGRGVYIAQPHRVQGVIMLLAGISDMIDP
ncbi:winged helix-turn-helix transcriptional regulator [Mobilitalea sibirica]|uniref:Winged helix-turn-helix transcriptional regulator n=1 Tax=Mobilitalea sibirica TaxID=1462919 RepID=A0A8J7H3P8_9FIRM|nr:winged helix-turn-helix domain-containing protein [Mobilitalea sibirica]MBH1941818.1 winged helix-turn-helix transcriptional regulator [Mobilitalea sibirica]